MAPQALSSETPRWTIFCHYRGQLPAIDYAARLAQPDRKIARVLSRDRKPHDTTNSSRWTARVLTFPRRLSRF